MKKVLVLANSDIGLYRFRKELITELNKEYRVFISLPYGDYIHKLEELGCKYIKTQIARRSTNVFKDIILLIKYILIFLTVKPDLVLTYTIKPNIYGGIVSRIFKIPYIVNITGLGTAVENRSLLQSAILKLYKIALGKAKCVFFQNRENLDYFRVRGVYGNYAKLLPGSGVNLMEYPLLSYPFDDKIHLLFIGRIMKEKGINQYLEAAKEVKEQYPNAYFHVIGFCEENYEPILSEMQKEGIILYHGMQNDIVKYLRISHCTVHPTYYPEGMSNVLLESASCGRPIITTNRSGCKEIVDDNVNGFLVKPQDSKDLINKIKLFISLDYASKKNMGLASRKKVEKEFDRKIVINEYLKEVKKCFD